MLEVAKSQPAEREITAGQRTFSGQNHNLSGHM